MSNTVSETALINLKVLSNIYSLDEYQRLVIIKIIYHFKYSVRNSLDKLERFQSYLKAFSLRNTLAQKRQNSHGNISLGDKIFLRDYCRWERMIVGSHKSTCRQASYCYLLLENLGALQS